MIVRRPYNTRTTPSSFDGVEEAGSTLGISGFVGYNFDLGPIVLGAEANLSRFSLDQASLDTNGVMLRAGWDRGIVLPFAGITQEQSSAHIDDEEISAAGTTLNLGIDYINGRALMLGAMISLPDFSANQRSSTLTASSGQEDVLGYRFDLPVVTLRAAYRF